MSGSGPKSEFLALERFTRELEQRYLEPHLTVVTLGPPSRGEQLDVAAFSVLAHGALENFLEGLTIWILGRVEKNWMKKRVSRSTATLLLQTDLPIDHESDTRTVFDLIREALAEAKSNHSKIVERNNGVAIKHLRTLLTPLGVDVPTDPMMMGALDTLVKMRHDWAHQWRYGAKSVKSAGDARKTIGDCMKLAKQLYLNTAALRL